MDVDNARDGTESPDTTSRWAAILDVLDVVLRAHNAEGWLVGGGLRDALMGLPVRDLDVAVSCEPIAAARLLRERLPVSIGELNRDAARVGLAGEGEQPALQLDLAPLHGPDIGADLRARDFTVNALALPLPRREEWLVLASNGGEGLRGTAELPGLIDPLGALADLQERRLVLASEHALQDDPGRILRAARIVAAFGFRAAPETLRLAADAAPDLLTLSPDRLRMELDRLLALPWAAEGLALLDEVGALRTLFPELDTEDARRHAVTCVRATQGVQEGALEPGDDTETSTQLRRWYTSLLPDGQPRIVALRLGLVLHARGPHTLAEADEGEDSGRGANRRVEGMRRLGLPMPERRILYEIDAHAVWTRRMLAEGMPDDAALRHLFETCGEAGVDVLVAAAACNEALMAAPVWDIEPSPEVQSRSWAILAIYFGDRQRLMPAPLLRGTDLIAELDMAAGPEVGRVLAAVRRAQLDGEISTREEALAYVRGLMEADRGK